MRKIRSKKGLEVVKSQTHEVERAKLCSSSSMASTARAFVLSRFGDLSLRPCQPPQPPVQALSHRLASPNPSSAFLSFQRRRSAKSASLSSGNGKVLCLVSGVDNGGVSDEFVSTRRLRLDQGFAVIANMLKKIEPLDMSVISQGVPDSAKDSMKETISTMLGLLPSEQFSVTIKVSKGPLDRLLMSSIITGYTLWNAEYRVMLKKNFDIPMEESDKFKQPNLDKGSRIEENDKEVGLGTDMEELEATSPQIFENLSPQALNYIQKLQSELSQAKEELNAQKLENAQLVSSREHRNDLLDYLRSLDSYMVKELSKPSSVEVEEIVHQLVQEVSSRFFEVDSNLNFSGDLLSGIRDLLPDDGDKPFKTIDANRDYLAKLLFWCMLLGHHLRGLENRLRLSCVVGLL